MYRGRGRGILLAGGSIRTEIRGQVKLEDKVEVKVRKELMNLS